MTWHGQIALKYEWWLANTISSRCLYSYAPIFDKKSYKGMIIWGNHTILQPSRVDVPFRTYSGYRRGETFTVTWLTAIPTNGGIDHGQSGKWLMLFISKIVTEFTYCKYEPITFTCNRKSMPSIQVFKVHFIQWRLRLARQQFPFDQSSIQNKINLLFKTMVHMDEMRSYKLMSMMSYG